MEAKSGLKLSLSPPTGGQQAVQSFFISLFGSIKKNVSDEDEIDSLMFSAGFDTEGLSSAVWPGGETEALTRLERHLERKVGKFRHKPEEKCLKCVSVRLTLPDSSVCSQFVKFLHICHQKQTCGSAVSRRGWPTLSVPE